MKKLFTAAPLALAIAAPPALAQSTEETLERMQQQLNAMQQQLNTTNDTGVRFNGFFSTGYARASNDAGFDGVTEESEVKDLSIFALQGSFDVTDNSEIVMQLVGRGEDNWDPQVEWAYLSYRPTNNLQVRAGKTRLPLFLYSDSLEVGYSQLWARAPQSVYGPISIKSIVGADAVYTHNLSNSYVSAQVFGGHTDEDGITGNVQLRNVSGLVLNWSNYVWTFRGVAATAEATIEAPALGGYLAENDRGNFYGLAGTYDNGTWQVAAEVVRVEVDGWFADTDSAYLSVGRRFGSITPYVFAGWIESNDDNERSGPLDALNTRRDEYSVGVRWDITSGVAIKGDVTHVRGFETDPNGLDDIYVLTSNTNSTNVYTLKIDSAF